jgi:hypothetical protein
MEKLKGVPNLVITHNHPGGRSLSIDDVVLATRMNAQEIRAVGRNEGHDVLYRISRGSNAQWPTSQDLVSEFSDADKKQLEKFGPMVREGKIRIPDANFLHGHEVWQAAAKALGLKYERVYDDPYPVVRVNA